MSLDEYQLSLMDLIVNIMNVTSLIWLELWFAFCQFQNMVWSMTSWWWQTYWLDKGAFVGYNFQALLRYYGTKNKILPDSWIEIVL